MSDLDRTIIKPRPGAGRSPDDITVIKPRPAGRRNDGDHTVITPRRKAPAPSATATVGHSPGAQALPQSSVVAASSEQSPLLVAAMPVLSAIAQVKYIAGTAKVDQLRNNFGQLVVKFSQVAKPGCDSDTISRASYALCATVDEAVLNTPWGENSSWSQKPLLSSFHRETYGGEKFYAILEQERHADVKRYELIELLYLCLSLGFMGKLRIDAHGAVKQEALRSQVYQLLKKQRDHFQQSLSDNAKPLTVEKGRLHSFLPIWLFAALLVLVGFLIYQNWLIDLNRQSDQVVTELASLIPKPREDALPTAQVRREVLFLQQLLAPEIERGILSVDDFANRSSITLHAGELFPSGSADIRSAYYPILDKIAKALESIPGDIKIYGHTDNVAIRTANFPSNWHLSLARASAVSKYVSQVALLTGRVLPEGRGDTEPVASNDTAEGRALNRRVTIELLYD